MSGFKFWDQIHGGARVALEHLEAQPNDLRALWLTELFSMVLGNSSSGELGSALRLQAKRFQEHRDSVGPEAINDELRELGAVSRLVEMWNGFREHGVDLDDLDPIVAQLELLTDDVDLLHDLGSEILSTGDAERAERVAEACVKLSPSHTPSQRRLRNLRTQRPYNRGVEAFYDGDYATAEFYAREALSIDPKHEPSHGMLLAIFQRQGRNEDLEELLDVVESEDPTVLTNQAYQSYRRGDFEGAVTRLELALSQSACGTQMCGPKAPPEALMNYTAALNELGRPEQSLNAFEYYPLRSEAIYANVVKSCIMLGDYARGKAIAAEALAEYPEPSHPYLPWNIACVFALSGAKLQAAGFVEMTLRLDPSLEDQLQEDPELEGVDVGAIARMGRRRSS